VDEVTSEWSCGYSYVATLSVLKIPYRSLQNHGWQGPAGSCHLVPNAENSRR